MPATVSFRDGFKFVNGRRVAPKFRAHRQGSDGVTLYTVVLWEDGGTSCNCPGWANRKTCKHSKSAEGLTRDELMTTADASNFRIPPSHATGSGRGFDL